MMADKGAPLAAVTAPALPPPCPILPCPALPCPALPCPAYHAPLPTIVIVMIIPTFLLPPWIRIPQQRSLRNSSFHRSLAPRRSIDRSCAPLLHFPISDPYLNQVLLLSSPHFSTDLQNQTSYKSHREDSVSRESFFVCFWPLHRHLFLLLPVFRLLYFCFSFCFAEVPMRASNLVLLLLSPFLFPY
jgi:hypothetical protein